MGDICLVRHGETEWNAQGRFQGQLDSPLTVLGRKQAGDMGALLAKVLPAGADIPMHVSPLGRTRDTAAILARHRPFSPVSFDSRLQEVTTGSWDGLDHAGIEAGWPGRLDGCTAFDWYFRSPDGEGYEAACERFRDWLRGVEGPVVAVSHGLAGRLIRGVYLGLSRDAVLCLPVPQDVVWHLCDGTVRAVAMDGVGGAAP